MHNTHNGQYIMIITTLIHCCHKYDVGRERTGEGEDWREREA
jgi:hypothetical protein